jgi:tetratricopeptide (TPR) repeat protein
VAREPYSARKLKDGWVAHQAGQFHVAAQHFENAVDNNPQLADGPALAWTAYWICQHTDRQDKYEVGVRLNELALQCGVQSAAVRNNLGHCYLQIGDLERAEIHLRSAIQHDKQLQAGFHNLIKLDLLKAEKKKTIPEIQYIKLARTTGAASAELLFDSAQALAIRTRHLANTAPESVLAPTFGIVGMSREALEQGMTPENLDILSELFPPLRDDNGFQQLRRSPVVTRPRVEPNLLVNPSGTAR